MKRFLMAILMACPVFGFAQSNYQKGYVVIKSNDTLKGYVDFKERRKNPVTVDFKTTLSSNRQIFTLANCSAYGVDGQESYQRFAVNISLSQTDIARLSIGPDLSFKRDTVFLKVLQAGKSLSLFSYTDELKTRFYIMPADSLEPAELIRNAYLNEENTGAVVKDNKYVRQLLIELKRLNVSNPAAEKALLRLDYNESAMLKVVSLINGQQLAKSKYKGSRFFAGAGLNASKAGYSGTHRLSNDQARLKTSYLPMLTAGIDLFVKPAIGRLIFRTELSLLMSKSEITVASPTGGELHGRHSFDRTSLVLTPQFIYNVYNTNKLKCFAGLGAGLNFSKTSNNKSEYLNNIAMENRVVENEVELEKFNYSAQLMAGVVLNKKIEIAAGYSPAVAISDYTLFNVTMQRIRIGINYLFGKH